MQEQELRQWQADYEGKRQELRKGIIRLEKERLGFVKRFSSEKLKDLEIDDYVIGSRRENTFCYLIENGLKELGDIHGATAYKFGIYYGKEKNDAKLKFRFRTRFGSNSKEAYVNVRFAIISLLEAGKSQDLDAIKANSLSKMFKGKILATYFPEKYLSIFSEEHLDHFMDVLGISREDFMDVVDKRSALMNFKNGDEMMKEWSNYEFMQFLYLQVGPPARGEVPDALKDYIPPKLPLFSEVNAEFVTLKLFELPPDEVKGGKVNPRKIDFEKGQRTYKRLGDRGEEIVCLKEKERLIGVGRSDLAGKVKHVAKKDDTAGYDVLSFDEDGTEKPIEVKSTTRKVGLGSFLLSDSELRKAKKIQNYHVYIVFEVDTLKPKVFPIKKPFDLSDKLLKLTPVNYRVEINLQRE